MQDESSTARGRMQGGHLTARQAAEYLGVARATLTKWRHLKTGPAHYVLGARAVRYTRADLDAFRDRGRRDTAATRTPERAA